MKSSHRISVLSTAAVAAVAVLSAVAPTQAAPVAYQTAVNNSNPYLYYRLQETGAIQDGPADNLGSSATDGIYRGADLTGGVAGVGVGSDTAVSFPGTNDRYLRTTDALSFGQELPQSSYEFLFKMNVVNPATVIRHALFGVINSDPDGAGPRTQNAGVQIEINNSAVNNVIDATKTRFWVRDEASNIVFGDIAHGNLTDGNYHHFVVTLDLSAPTADQIKAYIDGAAVAVTRGAQGAAAPSDFQVLTRDPVFAARNSRGTVDEEANVTLDEVALYGDVLSASDVAAHATAAGFVVPEPGSLALAGIAGLALLARRRRQA